MSNWWINSSGQNTLKGAPAYESEDGTVFKNEIQAQQYLEIKGIGYFPWVDAEGNPPDPENPIHLYNRFILKCLHTVPQARTDFQKMLPSLNSQEQYRFERMLEGAPFVTDTKYTDDKTITDQFMESFNSTGVRTTGRYGGTRIGGNI